MKAMLLRRIAPVESAPLEWVELPTPEPGPGEVRIRVRCCAVCRTDLHVIEGDLPQAKMPVIPGHQIVGTVDKLGPPLAVSQPRAGFAAAQLGQRVGVAWLRHTCGRCEFCTRGQENLCESARFTGYHADGGYAQYAVAPADFVYELPSPFGRGAGGEGARERTPPSTLTLSQRERGLDGFSDVEAAPLLVFRHHRLSGVAAVQSAAGLPAGPLRLRLVGPRGDPDRPAPRLRGVRGHPRREPPRVGPANGRDLGRRNGRRNAGQGRQCDHVRPGRRVGPAGAGEARKRGHALAGRHLHDAHPRDGLHAATSSTSGTSIRSRATPARTAASCWPRPPPSPSARTPRSIRWPRRTGRSRTSSTTGSTGRACWWWMMREGEG